MGSKWRQNWLEKSVALIVAVVFTLYVQAQLHPLIERRLNVPIEILNKPSGYEVDLTGGNLIEVTVRGVRDQLENLNWDKMRAVVDLANASPGMNRLRLFLRYPPFWNEFATFKPSTDFVEVKLVQRASRHLPVEVEWLGSPPSDQVVPEARLEPNRVTVTGWAEMVRKVKRVIVPFEITHLQGDLEMEITPVAQDEAGKPVSQVQLNPPQVRVQVRLIPQPSSKTVPISLRWSDLPPFPYRVIGYSVEPAQVQLRGDPEQLAQLNVVETEPISLANRRSDLVLTLPLEVPPGVRIDGKAFVKVKVRIRAEVEPTPPAPGETPRGEK